MLIKNCWAPCGCRVPLKSQLHGICSQTPGS